MVARVTRAAFAGALLLAGAGGVVLAQIDGGDRGVAAIDSSGSFEVNGIDVDVSAPTAEAARLGGWRLAQRKGWEMLAKRLGKRFVDLDAEIERRTGHNIPDIFAQEGEAAFRRYEAEVLAEVAKDNSQVIACGGGVIKNPANTRALRQNGPVLWVRRPLERLATGGRPLSKGGAALKQLEAERTPLYEAAATAVLENNSTLTEAVNKAVKLFEADETL